jgi:glycosyltransferase involved in cell wall biosynthesis
MKASAGKQSQDRSPRPAICIVVENLPVPLDRRVWQEACALRDAGYEVIVICPQMRGHDQTDETLDGIRIYRHWITHEAGTFWGYFFEYASALWGETRLAWMAWRKHRFRVLHLCNPPDLLFLVALPLKLFGGVRVIYDVHDLWPEMFEAKFRTRGPLYWMVRLAERLTYGTADVVLATNESVRHVAIGRGAKPAANVFVVRTAPKIPAQAMPADPALRKGRQFLIGYIGVMGDEDGVSYLIEAMRHIVNVRGRDDLQCLIMGTGSQYDSLVRMRDELGLASWIDLPGRVSNEFLFAALQSIDVGVGCDPTNVYNNACTMNKTLEYMAFAKPQVVFDLVEARASAATAAIYVKEVSGRALGDAILDLIDDPEKRREMGAFGHDRLLRELNWERSVQALLAAYKKALEIGPR